MGNPSRGTVSNYPTVPWEAFSLRPGISITGFSDVIVYVDWRRRPVVIVDVVHGLWRLVGRRSVAGGRRAVARRRRVVAVVRVRVGGRRGEGQPQQGQRQR